jgi:hypothetical protein
MNSRSTIGNGRRFAGCLISRRNMELVAKEQDGVSPFVVEFFMVQGIGFQCMAYCSYDGKWRTAFDNIELHGAIHVLE